MHTIKSTQKIVFLGLLVSMALVVHYIEGTFPVLLPGVPGAKLGLANILTLTALVLMGWKEALVVIVLRSFLGPILGGVPTSILYSMAGGLLSGMVMYLLYRFFARDLSLHAISIAGAVFHNIGQLAVAAVLFSNYFLFTYLPVMTAMAIPTGVFVGFSAKFLIRFVRRAKVGL